jgi:hypothetical protein
MPQFLVSSMDMSTTLHDARIKATPLRYALWSSRYGVLECGHVSEGRDCGAGGSDVTLEKKPGASLRVEHPLLQLIAARK